MQAWSLVNGNADIKSLFDDGIVMIDCLSSDTISKFVYTDNVGEIYYSNGDYVKYSRLKEDAIFDCQVHRKDGLLTIKIEDGKPVARYEFTSGKYKGFVFIDREMRHNKIVSFLGFEDLTNTEFFDYYLGYFYDMKKKVKHIYDRGSLFNSQTKEFVVLSDQMKQELEEKRKANQKKQEDLQPLYQKYGKKYVDAIMVNNKILVGTPEGLIKNHMNSSLTRESQYSKTYEVKGIMGTWAAIVHVDKKTKTVTSVTYR